MNDGRKQPDKKLARLRAMLYLAEQDAKAVILLATNDNHYAAYHCQQAAEKLIRAMLIQHEIEPGLSHHLDLLIKQIPDSEPWKSKLAWMDKYTPYATTFRYATPGGRIPTPPDTAGVIADAKRISKLIADALEHFTDSTEK